MIKTKTDLKEYMAADASVYGKKYPRLFGDEQMKYVITLRKREYYENTGNKVFALIYKFKHRRMSIRLGFDIPCNVFGKGLKINHFGYIVVSPKAKIGDWCDIHQGVNIGENTDGKAPVLGDNVWIGPGAKLFGGIEIGSNVMIGANSVVNKSFGDNVNVAGVPAKVINSNGNFYAKNAKN